MRFIVWSELSMKIEISIFIFWRFRRLNKLICGNRFFSIRRNMRKMLNITLQIFITRSLSKFSRKFSIFTGSSLKITNIWSITPLLICQNWCSMFNFISPWSHTTFFLKNFLFNFIFHSIKENHVSYRSFWQLYDITSQKIFKDHINKDWTIF